jgi:hypothetical protein
MASSSSAVSASVNRSEQRLIGWTGVGLFAAVACEYWAAGTLMELLWICHMSNLLMGVSVLAGSRAGIWTAALAVFLGAKLWLFSALVEGWTSSVLCTLSHVGGAALATVALWRVALRLPESDSASAHDGRGRCGEWSGWRVCGGVRIRYFALAAFVWGPFLQALARLFSNPALNINVAFDVHSSVADVVPSAYYGLYWWANILYFAALFALTEWAVEYRCGRQRSPAASAKGDRSD